MATAGATIHTVAVIGAHPAMATLVAAITVTTPISVRWAPTTTHGMADAAGATTALLAEASAPLPHRVQGPTWVNSMVLQAGPADPVRAVQKEPATAPPHQVLRPNQSPTNPEHRHGPKTATGRVQATPFPYRQAHPTETRTTDDNPPHRKAKRAHPRVPTGPTGPIVNPTEIPVVQAGLIAHLGTKLHRARPEVEAAHGPQRQSPQRQEVPQDRPPAARAVVAESPTQQSTSCVPSFSGWPSLVWLCPS